MKFSNMIHAVEVHAGGEPGRVIVGGVGAVPGATMFEKKVYLQTHMDHLRKRMLREPRGYPALCCNVLLPPTRPEAHAGFVIMEQAEYPAMSGSNTICVATVLIETGIVPVAEPAAELLLETPAGLISVRATVRNGKVTQVTFTNVPAFALHLDARLEVRGAGTLTADVAWGGMSYVIVDAAQLGLRLTPDEGRDLVRLGAMLRAAANEQAPFVHPENPAVSGVSGTQFTAPPARPDAAAKNTVVIPTGEFDWDRPRTWTGVIDRSACGTGTCARMATLHAKGRLPLHQDFPHESILGSLFTGRLIGETTLGAHPAVIPTLSGSAWIYGFSQWVLDSDDPYPEGFTVGDLW